MGIRGPPHSITERMGHDLKTTIDNDKLPLLEGIQLEECDSILQHSETRFCITDPPLERSYPLNLKGFSPFPRADVFVFAWAH